MMPIRQLLSRIRWDETFGRGRFELGYYDRVRDGIVVIPFAALDLDPADRFAFRWVDDEGVARTIPLHRVRQVFRDGALIWHRECRGQRKRGKGRRWTNRR